MSPSHSVYGPITPQQLDALAALIVELRPGRGPLRWTKTAVSLALQRAAYERTNDAELLIRSAVAGARRAAVARPEQLADDGPQWASSVSVAAGDNRKAPVCLLCHGPAHPDDVPHYPPPDAIPDRDRIREIRAAGLAAADDLEDQLDALELARSYSNAAADRLVDGSHHAQGELPL